MQTTRLTKLKLNKEKRTPRGARKSVRCNSDDIALKSFFLGPRSENGVWLKGQVNHIFSEWYRWRQTRAENQSAVISKSDKKNTAFLRHQLRTEKVIEEVLKGFEKELPKYLPTYIGHMFSEMSLPALLGHFITLLHNPNNISSEASYFGLECEKKAVRLLGKMVSMPMCYGHFTSGGTVANFEFMYRCRERHNLWLEAAQLNGSKDMFAGSRLGWEEFHRLQRKDLLVGQRGFNRELPGDSPQVSSMTKEPVLLVPQHVHYSWPKAMHYFGLGSKNIVYIHLDRFGHLCRVHLKETLNRLLQQKIPILGLVSIFGSTELGSCDPVFEIRETLNEFKKIEGMEVWLHVDAAYGGFLASSSEFRKHISGADSMTIDPHKLGYVPYSSGAFLCRDEMNYFISPFSGPYIQNQSKDVGQFTLEGSRSAAGAVATYLSLQSFGLDKGYGRLIQRTISSKQKLQACLEEKKINIFFPPGLDSNILCFSIFSKDKSLKVINKKNLNLFKAFEKDSDYKISKTSLDLKKYPLIAKTIQMQGIQCDSEKLFLMRLTLMNPFFDSKENSVDHFNAFVETLCHRIK